MFNLEPIDNQDLIQLAVLIVLIVTLSTIWIQLAAAKRQLRASVYNSISLKLQDEHARTARRKLMELGRQHQSSLDPTLVCSLDQNERAAIDITLHTIDTVGQFAERNWVDQEKIIDEWGDVIRRAYFLLKDFLPHYRSQTDWKLAYVAFERLGKAATARLGEPKTWRAPYEPAADDQPS